MATYVQISKIDVDIVKLKDVKDYIRVTTNQDDSLIKLLISSATSIIERCMFRDILTTEYENYRKTFFSDITLRRGEFQSLTSVEYLVDSAYSVLASTEYELRVGGIFGQICEVTCPSSVDDNCNALKITFKTGFGDDATFVPEDIKLAIMQVVMNLYENRGDCSDTSSLPMAAQLIVEKYSIMDISCV